MLLTQCLQMSVSKPVYMMISASKLLFVCMCIRHAWCRRLVSFGVQSCRMCSVALAHVLGIRADHGRLCTLHVASSLSVPAVSFDLHSNSSHTDCVAFVHGTMLALFLSMLFHSLSTVATVTGCFAFAHGLSVLLHAVSVTFLGNSSH